MTKKHTDPARVLLNLDDARAKGLGDWPEPDWGFLKEDVSAAPAFPVELFGSVSPYIKDASRGAGAPPDYVAAMLIAAVGAILGKKFSVRIQDDWIEALALWCVIVGPPSSGKTPACKPVRQRLRKLEKAWAHEHEERINRLIADAEDREADLDELNALRAKLETPPRSLVNDTTAEALARVEMRAPDGLLVERDELAGLIEGLERYGAGSDRAYYLEGYDRGGFTIDRVKAGTQHIENHSFAVFGGIQPDRFRSLLTHSGEDDGFAARLLIFWPEPARPTSIPKGADHATLDQAISRLDQFRRLSPGENIDLWLSDDAFQRLDRWYATSFSARRGTLGKIGSAYGKLAGMAARIAGCLHLLEHAFSAEAAVGLQLRISGDTMSAALRLIEDYFLKQIERAYDGVDEADQDRIAADLMKHCRTNCIRAFNIRQARRKWSIPGASRKGAAKEFEAAAMVLVDAGWIRPVKTGSGAKDFEVHPALFENTEATNTRIS